MISNRGFEVYVGNIDEQVTEAMLYNFFAGCGVITSVKIMRHIVTRKSRGFGFVNFARKDEALYAEEKLDGKKLINNHIRVYLKDKFKNMDKHANIIVSNLPLDITDSELKNLCEDFGHVFSVKILDGEDEVNHSKKAFVLFDNLQSAHTCIEGLNNTHYRNCKLHVESSVKKDVLYIKGPYNTDIKEDLSKFLKGWGAVEIDEIEKIEEGKMFMTTVRFQDEVSARAFNQEFKMHKDDCKLKSLSDQRVCRFRSQKRFL